MGIQEKEQMKVCSFSCKGRSGQKMCMDRTERVSDDKQRGVGLPTGGSWSDRCPENGGATGPTEGSYR